MGRRGPVIVPMKATDGTQAIAVNQTATVYSESVNVTNGEYFALAYQASSGGTIDLKIELEESHDDVSFAEPPSLYDIETSLEDSDYHCKTLKPIALPYIRMKITGGATNAASTTINLFLSIQRDY